MLGKMPRGRYEMKNFETLALSKAVKDKAAKTARKELKPGEYTVDMNVHLTGVLKINEDTSKVPTSTLLNQEFFALVLHHAGVTREAAVKVINEVASDYLADWTDKERDGKAAKAARKEKVEEFDPEGKIKAVFDGVKAKIPKTPVAGSASFAGEVEMVAGSEVEVPEVSVTVAESKEEESHG
jgi:hypothetical protein